MKLLKICAAVVFLFGSLALATLAGSIAARVTRRVSAWSILTLIGSLLLNVVYMLAAKVLYTLMTSGSGYSDWPSLADDAGKFAACGALLGLLGWMAILRNAPRFFQERR
ncbi:MAG TPA: hypothetical protein VG433_15655 [Pirellulales bacterium]|jgi:amino acid transporter|nr:hypothetical protein [Pirellulales bacterium]